MLWRQYGSHDEVLKAIYVKKESHCHHPYCCMTRRDLVYKKAPDDVWLPVGMLYKDTVICKDKKLQMGL